MCVWGGGEDAVGRQEGLSGAGVLQHVLSDPNLAISGTSIVIPQSTVTCCYVYSLEQYYHLIINGPVCFLFFPQVFRAGRTKIKCR